MIDCEIYKTLFGGTLVLLGMCVVLLAEERIGDEESEASFYPLAILGVLLAVGGTFVAQQ